MHTEKSGQNQESEVVVRCPECGSAMTEAYNSHEGSDVFIWYECSEPDCLGQWLRKVPAEQMPA